MRCGAALLLAALLVAEALLVEDEYKEALQDEERRTECEDCPRCPPPPANCTFLVSSGRKYFYNVDGVKLKIELEEMILKLTCDPGATLESASLPVFLTLGRFSSVELNACPAPCVTGGISRALSRLNITDKLLTLTLANVPPIRQLQPDLFAGLRQLRELHLSAEAGHVLEPPPGLLEPLTELRKLNLTDVRMRPATLYQLPLHLEELFLKERSPDDIDFNRVVFNEFFPMHHLAQPLVHRAPAPRSTDLENVTLTVAPGSCSALLRLMVLSPQGVAALPAGWLQVQGEPHCPRLYELRLYSCAMGGLPANALRGMTKLLMLTLTDCRELRVLPHGLFNDTLGLYQLGLANNALEVLPEGIFAPLRNLQVLNLSGNRLGVLGDGAAALGGVRSLMSLRILVLEGNPLGDTCGPSSDDATLVVSELSPLSTELSPLSTELSPLSTELSPLSTKLSPLHKLRALYTLSLAHTGASRLCEDWRRDLQALKEINLSYNNVTVLKYLDMQWYSRECYVDLRGNPLRDVNVTSKDYLSAFDDPPVKARVRLKFDMDLHACSCGVYWAARALRDRRLHVKLEGLTCAGRLLADAPFNFMCYAETYVCPEHCACTMLLRKDILVMHCDARRDLPDLALATGLAQHLELWLVGAHLTSLPDALPASLRVLNLRNASLPAATEHQAATLFADRRDVRLDGARVACACAGGARPALARALVAQRLDVRCAEDGRRVQELSPCPVVAEPGPRGAWPAVSGAVAATLVLAGAWGAVRRGSRLRVKAFLLARGLCTTWTRRDDDDNDCPYDVFFWFSRHDFAVASQIVRELEAGPRPLRVCVHYRDWRAGESILAQIQRSVVQSRRTLVLVSGHVARSVWARAVLREAAARALRDVTPRLVLALLPPAPPPAGDPELAHYVRANTYARWGDGAFWDRLRLALPPGRPRVTPTVAAPPHATAAVPPPSADQVP